MSRITKINKGDKFVCIKDVVMNPSGRINYQLGKIYSSEQDGCITGEDLDIYHLWNGTPKDLEHTSYHFIPYTYEAIWERYKAAKDMVEAEPYANLLRELESKVGRSTAGGGNYPADLKKDVDTRENPQCNLNCIHSKSIHLGDKFICTKPITLRHTFEHSPHLKEQVVSYEIGKEVAIEALIGYGTKFHISRSSYAITRDQLCEHFQFIGRREGYVEPKLKVAPEIGLPAYYDNSKGSLYQIAEQRGWSSYTFDVVKRLDRGGKKDPLEQEIRKSIGVLELWLKEIGGDQV